jgi:hypothetical protein
MPCDAADINYAANLGFTGSALNNQHLMLGHGSPALNPCNTQQHLASKHASIRPLACQRKSAGAAISM